ncbi:phospholipase D [Labrys miyagiensis]|uniref:phospholipase D n=1 Tax=Labrys miyagiensis TaxID=346912 RepID=A0ABQ6CID1_9HYPH|nr:phospholipase D-like domain-containing protein [Labrys miyagiensis]GLS20111.1 phospholipase D [Labrys miyagiensis]
MKFHLRVLAIVVALEVGAVVPPAAADEMPIIYYSPATILERIDSAIIAKANSTIDMAAFVLTDQDVIGALRAAADRGVVVRIYLDSDQVGLLKMNKVGYLTARLDQLASSPNVVIKTSQSGAPWMDQKGYTVDGQALRTGSANFSLSGEKFEDNDLILIPSVSAAAHFTQNFEGMWSREGNRDWN